MRHNTRRQPVFKPSRKLMALIILITQKTVNSSQPGRHSHTSPLQRETKGWSHKAALGSGLVNT